MSGKTDIFKGRVKEAAGVLSGNDALREEGQTDQAVGKAKYAGDQAVRAAQDAAHTAIVQAKQVARESIDRAKNAAKELYE